MKCDTEENIEEETLEFMENLSKQLNEVILNPNKNDYQSDKSLINIL